MNIIDECVSKLQKIVETDKSVDKRLNIVADTLDVLRHTYTDQWREFELSALADPLAFPLLKAHLHDWEPLAEDNAQPVQLQNWYQTFGMSMISMTTSLSCQYGRLTCTTGTKYLLDGRCCSQARARMCTVDS